MSNKFTEREKGFEKKFVRDEELQFKIQARSNKYLAEFVLEKLDNSDKKIDLLALSYFLNRDLNFNQLKREIKLMANIDNIDEVTHMLQRGYTEIKEYINEKADDNIKGLFP